MFVDWVGIEGSSQEKKGNIYIVTKNGCEGGIGKIPVSWHKYVGAGQIALSEKELKTLVASYDYLLSKAEKTYFELFYHLNHRMKQFYITMKIHKNPMGTCPIVSCCGSFIEGFLIWLDFKMKSLIEFVPTFVQDSYQVLREMKDLNKLLHNARGSSLPMWYQCILILIPNTVFKSFMNGLCI
jgi:hypothetical protein